MGASGRKGNEWDMLAYSSEETRVLAMERRNLSGDQIRKGWKWRYQALNEELIPAKGRSPQPVFSKRVKKRCYRKYRDVEYTKDTTRKNNLRKRRPNELFLLSEKNSRLLGADPVRRL